MDIFMETFKTRLLVVIVVGFTDGKGLPSIMNNGEDNKHN